MRKLRTGVIYVNQTNNGGPNFTPLIKIYHKYGSKPKTFAVNREIIPDLLFDDEIFIRSEVCPTNIELAKQQNYFTNSRGIILPQ